MVGLVKVPLATANECCLHLLGAKISFSLVVTAFQLQFAETQGCLDGVRRQCKLSCLCKTHTFTAWDKIIVVQ